MSISDPLIIQDQFGIIQSLQRSLFPKPVSRLGLFFSANLLQQNLCDDNVHNATSVSYRIHYFIFLQECYFKNTFVPLWRKMCYFMTSQLANSSFQTTVRFPEILLRNNLVAPYSSTSIKYLKFLLVSRQLKGAFQNRLFKIYKSAFFWKITGTETYWNTSETQLDSLALGYLALEHN